MREYLLNQLDSRRCADTKRVQDILDGIYSEVLASPSPIEAKSAFLDGIRRIEYERDACVEAAETLKRIYLQGR
ncbi:MAG: hypothetical protein ABH829_00720 [archaeon]